MLQRRVERDFVQGDRFEVIPILVKIIAAGQIRLERVYKVVGIHRYNQACRVFRFQIRETRRAFAVEQCKVIGINVVETPAAA